MPPEFEKHLDKLKTKYRPRDIVVVDPELWKAMKPYIPAEINIPDNYVIQEPFFIRGLALIRV